MNDLSHQQDTLLLCPAFLADTATREHTQLYSQTPDNQRPTLSA